MEDKASTWEIALLRLGMPFRNYLLFFALPVSLVGLVAGLAAARRGLAATLQRHGVSMEDAATHEGLRRLSTTRGAASARASGRAPSCRL